MTEGSERPNAIEPEVLQRFGLYPSFFRSAAAPPAVVEELWRFTRAGYLDNPLPSLFKERMFVSLSRFCQVRYCVVRHAGFLLGYGRPAGDPTGLPQTVDQVNRLLRSLAPSQRDMGAVYESLERLPGPVAEWPGAETELEDQILACATVMFLEPYHSERARGALAHAVGSRRLELLCGCLAVICLAHDWTALHPEIELDEDLRSLIEGHDELARLLLADPEADRWERLIHPREGVDAPQRPPGLEAFDARNDRFIAVLAHELRNPLAAIRAATDALGFLELEDPRVSRLQERLDRQTRVMARMLEDLLEASRITLGKISVQSEALDLSELLLDIVGEQEPRARDAGLRMDTRIEGAPCGIRGDRVRLRQIIDNLLSNAIKFTPAGGSITVTLSREPEWAVVAVRDTGVGFDPASAAKLFEPFTQEEHGLGRRGGGLGLGLAIATRLAELQGGSLAAHSPGRGQGALFEFRVPLDAASAPDGVGRSMPARRVSHASILVVEDDRDVAEGMAELLKLAGFEVSVAPDGRSAISSARNPVPDIILCDLGLPGDMDGFAVARACRSDPALSAARLIAISGYSAPEDHASARMAGFERLVAKPLTRESLDALLG